MSIDNLEKEFDLENYFPRDVSYSREKRPIYDRLMNESISPLKGKLMADIFMYSVIFGFINTKSVPLEKPVPQIPSNALGETEKSLLLATMISSSSKGVDVLLDKDEVRKSLEQYANGGIEILEKYLTEGKVGDSLTNLESKMREIINSESSTETKSKESRLEEIERTPEAMKQLSLFENNLRLLIPKVLSQKTEDWEKSLPNNGAVLKIWKESKERSEKALKQYDRSESFDLIDFSHLGQLQEIIINKNLWELFEPIFGNIDVFKSNMIEITMIRNDPAHGRGLTETQLDVLKAMLAHKNEQIDKALQKL